MELDHIKPVSIYPELTFELSNLQILCGTCNKKKSNTKEIDFRSNLKKIELWNRDQRKAFRLLINKEKIYNPIILKGYLKYKGTLKMNLAGDKEERKPRKRLSESRYDQLMAVKFSLEDIIYNRGIE